MLEVAVVLGKGLLKNSTPEGSILTHFGRVSFEPSLTVRFHWQKIVNDDCVRDTKDEEIHTVDAAGALLVFIV